MLFMECIIYIQPGMKGTLQETITNKKKWRVMYGFTGVIYFGGGIVDGRICGVRV